MSEAGFHLRFGYCKVKCLPSTKIKKEMSSFQIQRAHNQNCIGLTVYVVFICKFESNSVSKLSSSALTQCCILPVWVGSGYVWGSAWAQAKRHLRPYGLEGRPTWVMLWVSATETACSWGRNRGGTSSNNWKKPHIQRSWETELPWCLWDGHSKAQAAQKFSETCWQLFLKTGD